ncbi:hypothetical protein SAMN05421878_10735 [Actinobaculum suis]|uniref:Uncharacterized protein n=1 Tax=Actinobaculum suis TaxID=1657 RepID=A0A1G7CAF4_9ACTO|nr:hypothetical protein SAMN05421878_10735 [Actinobaculum suis]
MREIWPETKVPNLIAPQAQAPIPYFQYRQNLLTRYLALSSTCTKSTLPDLQFRVLSPWRALVCADENLAEIADLCLR